MRESWAMSRKTHTEHAAIAPRTSQTRLGFSDQVRRALEREADLPGDEFLVVVRESPGKSLSARTIGRFAHDKASNAVRIEDVVGSLHPVLDLSAFAPDAKAKSLLRGVEQAKADLKLAGGVFSLDEVRTLLGDISRQAVHTKVQRGQIFTVKVPSGRIGFPTLQFTPDGPVSGMEDVIKVFPSSNRWMFLNFLVHPAEQLGNRRPIEVLKSGQVAAVVHAAETLGVQGG